MYRSRLEFHEVLTNVTGLKNIYFQPPASVKMEYPAIVYSRSRIENRHAGDSIYTQMVAYSVTVIDKDPDSEIVEKVSEMPYCRHDRNYSADNLNHDVFTIYY